MFTTLQALRIRVRAALEAIFGATAGDEAKRAYAQAARAANDERELLSAGAWREVEEHRAFLNSVDSVSGKKNHRSQWTQ